jgi:hypothetical protein
VVGLFDLSLTLTPPVPCGEKILGLQICKPIFVVDSSS